MSRINSAKAMDDEALSLIAGGDWGDTNWEINHDCNLYKPGDIVEVYTNNFHLFTKSATVIGTRDGTGPLNVTCKFVRTYYVVVLRDWTNTELVVNADQIERN